MSPRWAIGHADLADLAARELVVGVVAGLRRQVEGDRQAGLALGQVARGTARWTSPRSNGPRRSASSTGGRAGPGARSWRRILRCAPLCASRSENACATRCGCARSTSRTALSGRRDRLVPPRRLDFVGHSDFVATGDEFLGHFVELGGLQPDARGARRRLRDRPDGAPARRLPRAARAPTTASTSTATAIGWCRRRYARLRELPLPGRRPLQPPLQPARRAQGGRLPLPVRRRRASTS